MRNKKHTVKAKDGSIIRVSQGKAKKIRQCFLMARKLKGMLEIHPNFQFSLISKNGEYIYGSSDKGKSLGAIRRLMGRDIDEKREQQLINQ